MARTGGGDRSKAPDPAGVGSLLCGADLPYSRKTSGPQDHNSVACDFSLWAGTRPMALRSSSPWYKRCQPLSS